MRCGDVMQPIEFKDDRLHVPGEAISVNLNAGSAVALSSSATPGSQLKSARDRLLDLGQFPCCQGSTSCFEPIELQLQGLDLRLEKPELLGECTRGLW
jgi:hypothetical protein